jgi:toll-like receptor 13
MLSLKTMEPFAFRSNSLESVDLKCSDLRLSDASFSASCFQGSPKLTTLNLARNYLADLPDDKYGLLFGSIPKLKVLYLAQCEIASLTLRMFSSLKRLSTFYLHHNKITRIPDGVFDSCPELTGVNLAVNQLQTISETAFSSETIKQLRHVDLSENPLMCDCNLVWFKGWFSRNASQFNHSLGKYTCANRANTTIHTFSMTEQACLLSRESSSIIIACVVMTLSIVAALAIVYHLRWHIRLLLAFRGQAGWLQQQEDFTYDAFLSCAEEEEAWVEDYFLPVARHTLGLRVCFHKQDFVPGKPVLNNIVDSVQACRKFLLLFSPAFAASSWCQFELDLCLSQALHCRPPGALIVVRMGDLASRDLTGTMAALMETTTYMEWRRDRDAIASFWDRLRLCF